MGRCADVLIQQSIKNNLLLNNIEKSYIITRLKEMTIPELLEALAEAYAGDPSHIYGYLQPDLIDKTTDALADFREMVKRVKR